MAKGRQVKKALLKAGWVRVRQSGSHVHLRRDGRLETFSYHDGVELGTTQLRFVAKKFDMSLEELKRLPGGGVQVEEVAAQTRIPVEFFYDEEAQNWGFVVDTPSVVGGGDATLDAAMQHAAEAIAFALEGSRPAAVTAADRRVEYLPVVVG